MGYIGNQSTNAYSSFAKQTITGNGGTVYTLTSAIANSNEIEVFVNNVRQEPGVAYTAANTTITMTGNVLATDNFYVVYQGKTLQTIVPPDGSVTAAKLSSGGLGAGYFQGENGATGDTTNGKGDIFRVHEQQLDTNVTIASTDNALCAGPLTLATGVTVTVNGNLVIA